MASVLLAKENERAVLGGSSKGLGLRSVNQPTPAEPAQKKVLQDASKPRRALGDITNNKSGGDSSKSVKGQKPAAKPSRQVEPFVDVPQKQAEEDFEIPDMPHRHPPGPPPLPNLTHLIGPLAEFVEALEKKRPMPKMPYEVVPDPPEYKEIEYAELEPAPVFSSLDDNPSLGALQQRIDDSAEDDELDRELFRKTIPLEELLIDDFRVPETDN
eukprot:tig00000241_g21050.t1